MRQVTYQVVGAFQGRQSRKVSNTESTGDALYLHGNKIAEWDRDNVPGLWITNAGWSSNTTKERLNGLRGVDIRQKNYTWYLNGKEWDGGWTNVSRWDANDTSAQAANSEDDGAAALRSIALIAKLGDIIGADQDQKARNDWKTRMLKAGLEGRGLIMPEDWDTLREEEKERRLNGAIDNLL